MTEEFDQEQPADVKLVVTEEMRSYLYDITKWAKFLSIVGFVFTALLILVSLSVPTLLSTNPALAKQMGPLGQGGATIITVIYLILALLLFYPSLLLSKISNKGKQGVLFGDQESLNASVYNLKSLFKFAGVFALVIIIGYFLLVFLVGAGVARV